MLCLRVGCGVGSRGVLSVMMGGGVFALGDSAREAAVEAAGEGGAEGLSRSCST